MLRTHKGKLRPFNWMAFFFDKEAVNIDRRILQKILSCQLLPRYRIVWLLSL